MNDYLQHIILKKEWDKLIEEFSLQSLVQTLSFEEAMSLAYDLFFENFLDSPRERDFALNLFFTIRKHYPSKWDNDWKHDILLSGLCQLGYKYDEYYYCCMRAYKKFEDPPPAVLIALAGCYYAPKPKVTRNQAEELLTRAIRKEVSYEAALQLKGIYMEKHDQAKVEYWARKADYAERNNIRTDPCTPDIFKDKPAG